MGSPVKVWPKPTPLKTCLKVQAGSHYTVRSCSSRQYRKLSLLFRSSEPRLLCHRAGGQLWCWRCCAGSGSTFTDALVFATWCNSPALQAGCVAISLSRLNSGDSCSSLDSGAIGGGQTKQIGSFAIERSVLATQQVLLTQLKGPELPDWFSYGGVIATVFCLLASRRPRWLLLSITRFQVSDRAVLLEAGRSAECCAGFVPTSAPQSCQAA